MPVEQMPVSTGSELMHIYMKDIYLFDQSHWRRNTKEMYGNHKPSPERKEASMIPRILFHEQNPSTLRLKWISLYEHSTEVTNDHVCCVTRRFNTSTQNKDPPTNLLRVRDYHVSSVKRTVQHFDPNGYPRRESSCVRCEKSTKRVHVPDAQAKTQLRLGSDEFQMFHILLILNPIIFHKGWNPLLITAFPHEREK